MLGRLRNGEGDRERLGFFVRERTHNLAQGSSSGIMLRARPDFS